jgi:hypothetical protein
VCVGTSYGKVNRVAFLYRKDKKKKKNTFSGDSKNFRGFVDVPIILNSWLGCVSIHYVLGLCKITLIPRFAF